MLLVYTKLGKTQMEERLVSDDPSSGRQEIARRIRGLRKAKELSILKMAEAVGMSPGYLSEVERGFSVLSSEKLARLASALGVTADYLLTGRAEAGATSIHVPLGLSEAAKALDLTFEQTMRLLAGNESLRARRSGSSETEWSKEQWIAFYRKVKDYL